MSKKVIIIKRFLRNVDVSYAFYNKLIIYGEEANAYLIILICFLF